MTVTFRLECICDECGAKSKGVEVVSVRVNKRSLRSTSAGLIATRHECGDRNKPLSFKVSIVGLAEDSLTEVNEYRARKGWPAMTQEQVAS